ncbi:DUF6907 domain-containing protein [Streptomyces sp. NPDC048462]|uniref:DUF6907 domain-containing protein n=1 Tax=Streptomyces sp. NPDC048462 TaxID=3365555 RepID=UPI003713E478
MQITVPTLSSLQLDGLACVGCGADDTEQQPTGDRSPSGAQLFRCTDADVCRAQRSVNAQFPRLAALRAESAPATAWRSLSLGDVSTIPVAELLKTLGVRVVEVDGELSDDGAAGALSGRVGEATIRIERSLPQADRERVVRALLARISPAAQQYTVKADRPVRMVPARVDGHTVLIDCPAWCTFDHVAEDALFLDDVYHSTDTVTLMAPRVGAEDAPLVNARLNADTFGSDEATRRPLLIIAHEDEALYMTPEQAGVFADGLVAFAESVRALAAQAGGVR